MSTDLMHFQRYAQELLSERFKEVDIVTVIGQNAKGHFFYTISVYLDNQLCQGTGISHNKAIENAIACLADYQPEYEHVTL